MIGLVRATVICATLALGLTAAGAADKAFKRDELADSAVKLEAQIKSEAGPVAKSSATLRNDADAAFRRADFRVGLQILGQIAATTPEDSANWLKLAKTIFQIRSASSSEQTFLYERASTAAYIAYQRAGNQAEEADALAVLGRAMSERKLWRPALDALRLSLDMREVAEVRGQYEKMRDQHGFRLLDYTVDSDGASPRACFQFSEDLAKRVDFAPFLALAGTDKPALTSRGQAALRRRAEAWRALQHQSARRPAVHGQGDPCRNRPSSTSMSATASRSCASRGAPMCCRAPASAAFRWSASIRRR